MSDDRQHEYVLHEWRDIAVGTRDECRERLDAARAEANNMAEALRVVNARLVEVTAERDGFKQRDAAWRENEACETERDSLAYELRQVNQRLMEEERLLVWWREKAKELRAERDAARQSRKRAVWAVSVRADEFAQLGGGLRKIIEGLEVERDVARQTTRVWKARAEKCEAERALSQQMREDDGR